MGHNKPSLNKNKINPLPNGSGLCISELEQLPSR